MPVKNLMEDIVANTLNEVLSNNKELSQSIKNREDIIAYVLNRVPPKYFTSERGMLHGKLEEMYKTQQSIDVLLLVHEAVDIVLDRRKSSAFSGDDKIGRERSLLPHIIGTVLEESTFSIIPEVEVTLLYKKKPAAMTDESWTNPYKTNRSTRGFYHFWPAYSEAMGSDKKIPFTLKFKHPKFNEKTQEIEVEIATGDNGKSHVIPIILMEIKEGENVDFLYGDET